ncbi:MAG: lytic transglycosylase domain-containing protein, partial [Chitinophagaceae bacterium]
AKVFVKDYIRKNDESLSKIRLKSDWHFNIMDSIFMKYNLPIELKYLAVIESELNSTATSRVGAKGPWQFMPATAKVLGLKITRRYDERTNYYKSTRAAALYLRDLHRQFGDWLLVVAAYNCGPGNVLKAIKKTGSRNFWKLQNSLPAESRGHVKKFIATHYYFEGQGGETTMTKAELQKLLAQK